MLWVRLHKLNHDLLEDPGLCSETVAQLLTVPCPALCSNMPHLRPLAHLGSLAQDGEQLTARERAMSSHYHSQQGGAHADRQQGGGTLDLFFICSHHSHSLCF